MKEITESTSIREIDNFFLFDGDTELKILLKKTHEYQPIELVTIIHFLLTHIRDKKNLVLHTNISDEDANLIQTRFFDYYIIVCCLLFNKELKIVNARGHVIYTNDLFEKLINKLRSQEELYARDLNSRHIQEVKKRFFSSTDKSKNEEGLSFLVTCFDHLENSGLAKSNYLYHSNRTNGPRDISVWFERLFRFNDINISLSEIFYDLSTVISELVQNTHDWARTTFDNENFIKPNLRACSVNIFLEDKLSFDSSSYDHIHEYIKQVSNSEKAKLHSPNKQIQFEFTDQKRGICEISILDTGPGMASRWLKRAYSGIEKKEEVNAVISCFHKYFTSDASSKHQLRGRGLINVIGIIGRSGLIRVRTGHSLVQRNFLAKEVRNQELIEGKISFEIIEEGLSFVDGTTISILYPFVYTPNIAAE